MTCRQPMKWLLLVPAFGLMLVAKSCFSATGDMLKNGQAYCSYRDMNWVPQANNIPAYCVGENGEILVVPERQMWCDPSLFNAATAKCSNKSP